VPPILPDLVEGPSLVLRCWRTDDVVALSQAVERNVEHLRPWMPWIADEPLTPGKRLELVETWEKSRLQGGDVIHGVFADGRVVGGCGLHRRRGPHGLEIGYWVDKDHVGRGVGTEVARSLTTAALGVPGVTFVEIHHDKANVASGGIPRRLGYEFIGETASAIRSPSEVGIACCWRMEADDWPVAAASSHPSS
jgi:ribosomal-protein-serine acetyltransferase